MRPAIFYRVHSDGCATTYNPNEGFVAGDTESYIPLFPDNNNDRSKLCRAIARHLDWNSRVPSPFISVYANREAAITAATARYLNDERGNVYITKIDLTKVDQRNIFVEHIGDIAKEIELDIPGVAWNNSKHEYLFFRSIPKDALVRTWPIQKRGTY